MSETAQGLLDQPQQAAAPPQAPNADGMAALYQGVTQQLAQQQQALQDQVLAQRQSPEGQRIPQAVVEQLGIGGNYGQLDTGKFNNFVAQQTGWNPGSLAGWGGGNDAAGTGPSSGGLLGGLGAGPAATSGTVGATGPATAGQAGGFTTGPGTAGGWTTGSAPSRGSFDPVDALVGGLSGYATGGPLGAGLGIATGGFGHSLGLPGGLAGGISSAVAAATHGRDIGKAIIDGILGTSLADRFGVGGATDRDLAAQLEMHAGAIQDTSMSPSMSFEPGVGPGLAGMGSGGNPEEDTSGVEQGTW